MSLAPACQQRRAWAHPYGNDSTKFKTKMALYIGSIVIPVSNIERAKNFWQAALGYAPREADLKDDNTDFVVLSNPNRRWANISLQLWPEPKISRNRLHLDLYSDNQAQEVEQLEVLGAVRLNWHYEPGDDFVVMADPDGNEFCVVNSPFTQD